MKITKSSLLLAGALAAITFLAPSTASAQLISSESFWTQSPASGGSYEPSSMNTAVNRAVIAGNFGFDTNNIWNFGTGTIGASTSPSLTGSVVPGSSSNGSARIGFSTNLFRSSWRRLASTPTSSSSYYLSGLVRVGALANLQSDDRAMMGFMATNPAFGVNNFATGFHFGARNDGGTRYLSAFAGNNIYDLLALDSTTVTNTYQIVLSLTVDASGTETLTPLYATSDATVLTLGGVGSASVETWTGAASFDYFALQSRGGGINNGQDVNFDEMRFGTALSDVTTVPEPATVSLLLGGILFIYLARRKRRLERLR